MQINNPEICTVMVNLQNEIIAPYLIFVLNIIYYD